MKIIETINFGRQRKPRVIIVVLIGAPEGIAKLIRRLTAVRILFRRARAAQHLGHHFLRGVCTNSWR